MKSFAEATMFHKREEYFYIIFVASNKIS